MNTYDTKEGKTRSQVEKQWDDTKFSSLRRQKIKHFFFIFINFIALYWATEIFLDLSKTKRYLTVRTPLQACIDVNRHMTFLFLWTLQISFIWMRQKKKAKVIELGKRLDSKLLCGKICKHIKCPFIDIISSRYTLK